MPDINVRVQVDGVNELLQGFQRVTTSIQPAMADLAERVKKRLETYPAPPPNSTYIRTGELGRSWAVSADARGTNLYQDRVSVSMSNDAEGPDGRHYAAWVQGAPGDGPSQTAQHKETGWLTTQQALDAEAGPFLDNLSRSIESAWSR